MEEAQLGQLFSACDIDGSGYIDQTELSSICSELSADELQTVFKELDVDGDGRISVNEFAKGFREISESLIAEKRQKRRQRLQSIAPLEDDTVGYCDSFFEEGLKALACHEKVVDLYQKLHSSGTEYLVTHFEGIILDIIKDVRQVHADNKRLEDTFHKEKIQHEEHLHSMEEEMEHQMQKVAARVRKEEQEKAEIEYASVKEKCEDELSMLQLNVKRLQTELDDTKNKELDEQVLALKNKMEEMNFEKRQLQSDLTDAQTSLALQRSELVSIRQQFEEKCHEVDLEKETAMEYLKEQDNLTRQLHLLHDANKTLHDTNDDLREALDSNKYPAKRPYELKYRPVSVFSPEEFMWRLDYSPNRKRSAQLYDRPSPRVSPRASREGSVVSDYACTTPRRQLSVNSSLADELSISNRGHSPVYEAQMLQKGRLMRGESCEDDSFIEDLDSGHSTMRDLNEADTESDGQSVEESNRFRRRRRRQPVPQNDLPDMLEIRSDDDETLNRNHMDDSPESGIMVDDNRRIGSAGSRDFRGSMRSVVSIGSNNSGRSSRRQPAIPQEQRSITTRATKEPERMFKIVLAGDAAVGKSSFIMRLCKGKFENNLSSTLGVDFHTKLLEVDGRVVALQLWDTAGQERFRSIAKSYFRRADGVLMLYDCTYERSYLNIRDWVEAVEDGAQKKVPIMLCANKIDMREEMEQKGAKTVSYEEGSRLARVFVAKYEVDLSWRYRLDDMSYLFEEEFEALFIETSAKDGSNTSEAVMELARLLRTTQDIEVKSVGMQLHESTYNKKSSGCCNM